jgi:hypothetical protein
MFFFIPLLHCHFHDEILLVICYRKHKYNPVATIDEYLPIIST